MRQTRLTIAAIAALLLLAIAGCEGDEDAEPPRAITEEGIERYEAGTPQRTVVEWWREVQFKNARGAIDHYAPKVELTRTALGRQLLLAGNSFVGVPEIASVDDRGEKATIYATIERPGSDAPPRNVAVNLVDVGGEWLLADNVPVEQVVSQVIQARQAQERSQ